MRSDGTPIAGPALPSTPERHCGTRKKPLARRPAATVRYDQTGASLDRHADRPVAACRSRYSCITSSLRSALANRTHAMPLADANDSTPRRNLVLIFSISAGEGIGMPRCWVMNATTCPLDCRMGTYALR